MSDCPYHPSVCSGCAICADEQPTSPGTPAAIRLRKTASGAFEMPREVAETLVAAQIKVLQDRVAVLEAELAAVRAQLRGPTKLTLATEERGELPPDPRAEP